MEMVATTNKLMAHDLWCLFIYFLNMSAIRLSKYLVGAPIPLSHSITETMTELPNTQHTTNK